MRVRTDRTIKKINIFVVKKQTKNKQKTQNKMRDAKYHRLSSERAFTVILEYLSQFSALRLTPDNDLIVTSHTKPVAPPPLTLYPPQRRKISFSPKRSFLKKSNKVDRRRFQGFESPQSLASCHFTPNFVKTRQPIRLSVSSMLPHLM